MPKNRVCKKIGYVNDDIIKKWFLDECRGKEIVQSLDLYIHIAPHAKQFLSVDSFNYTIDHVVDVINAPDYVYYNVEKHGIEYYKKLLENVCVVVQNTGKRELYVASIYPVSEVKIRNRKLNEEETIKKQSLKKYGYKKRQVD